MRIVLGAIQHETLSPRCHSAVFFHDESCTPSVCTPMRAAIQRMAAPTSARERPFRTSFPAASVAHARRLHRSRPREAQRCSRILARPKGKALACNSSRDGGAAPGCHPLAWASCIKRENSVSPSSSPTMKCVAHPCNSSSVAAASSPTSIKFLASIRSKENSICRDPKRSAMTLCACSHTAVFFHEVSCTPSVFSPMCREIRRTAAATSARSILSAGLRPRPGVGARVPRLHQCRPRDVPAVQRQTMLLPPLGMSRCQPAS